MNKGIRILLMPVILGVVLTNPACKHQKDLSVSENQLRSQIELQESQRSDEEKKAQLFRDSLARLPQGFRYEENRSLDPNHPPIRLRFTDSLPQRAFKLSEIADELEYIVIKTSRDTALFIPTVEVDMGSEYIVTSGLQGIELFDKKGNWLKTILKSSGYFVRNGYPGGYSPKELFGMPFMDISVSGDTFLYCLLNGPANKASIMRVDQEMLQTAEIQTSELQKGPQAFGKEIKQTDTKVLRKIGYYHLGNDLWASLESKWNSGTSGDLLTIFGPTGDSLCQFKDYQRIENFPGGPSRRTDRAFSYHFNGTLSFKPAHNDTLFRIIPPNRLLPAYLFDFGVRKIDVMEGVVPSIDLSEKNLAYELFETNKYFFFVYTRNHIIPRTLRSGNYRYIYTLIDKSDNRIYHISSIDNWEGGLTNDIDQGLPFWPDGVTEEGIPYMYCSGEEFIKRSGPKLNREIKKNDIVLILAR